MATHRNIAVLAFTALLAHAADSTPEGYSRRIWRSEDGLPQNKIQAISQTPDGYLWIGTSEGLARFDGVRFTVFDRSNTPAFPDDSIVTLAPSKDGSFWIGTEGGGLVRLQNRTFHVYGTGDGLTNGFIRAIFEDTQSNLWVGTDRGLFRMEGTRFTRLDGTAEVPLASVRGIGEDGAKRLWVATGSAGLLVLDHGKLIRAPCENDPGRATKTFYRARDGVFRAIADTGVYRFDKGCPVRERDFPSVAVSSIQEDAEGNLWAGTIGLGLFRKHGTIDTYHAPAVLPDNSVSAIFEDSEQNLWVGAQDGLLRLSKKAVTTIGEKDGLLDDNISTIYPDRKGELWIATITGQLYLVSNGHVTRIRGVPPVRVRTVMEDKDGALWLGTNGNGLVRIVKGRPFAFTTNDGLRNNSIRDLLDDSSGTIWIATASGLSHWDGHSFHNYYLEDGLTYPSVRCITALATGEILAGTDAGLTLIRSNRIVRDAPYAELARDKVWAIHQDRAGVLWVGTRGGGLVRIEGGRHTRYTTHDGLPSNSIYQILEDAQGKLWISSPAGVFSMDRTGPGKIALYGASDGMETSQMNGGGQPAGCKSASGDLWFPSVKGAVRIDPARLPARISTPVIIERLATDGNTVPMSADIVIPPGRKKLEIDYTVCALLAPQRVSFQYKLEGFDDAWTPSSKSRTASYTNLPPHRYRFCVRASNGSEASVSFDWRPPLYRTPFFYVLCAAAALACGCAGLRLYARQTRARYALLLNERIRLAREMHDTVIQGCVGVSTLLEATARFQRADPEEASRLLDQAKVEVKSTLEEARQAVWNLRHSPAGDSAIERLRGLARKLSEESGVRIEMEVVGQAMPLESASDRTLLLVAREALRNAVAHAAATEIRVRFLFQPEEVRLEVADNGKGFDAQAVLRSSNGHFGLIGMRERVEQLGGAFEVSSGDGQGTRVLASFPR